MSEKLFQAAVDAIYDAASTQEAWGPALTRLSEFFGCTIATIIERNLRTSVGRGVAVGVDEASQAEFFSVWGNRNPFVQAAQYIRPKPIDTDQDILSKAALLKTDYYNGFMKQRDMHSLLRITLQKEDDFHQSISIMGPHSLGGFSNAHIEKCRLFLPHLHRAAKLARQWNVATSVIQSINHILELRREGIISLNLHGRVVFANHSARSMAGVRDSFVLRGDRIKALRSGEDAELQRLISGAVYQLQGVNSTRGNVMRLSRSTGARDYAVLVSLVPTKGLAIHDNHSVVGCIMIADPQTSKPSSQSALMKLFKLTPGEARPCTHKPSDVMRRTQCPLCPYSGRDRAAAQYVAMGQKRTCRKISREGSERSEQKPLFPSAPIWPIKRVREDRNKQGGWKAALKG